MLAVARAELDREDALALRAAYFVAVDCDLFSVDFEVGAGGEDFAAVGGGVSQADNAAAFAVFHFDSLSIEYCSILVTLLISHYLLAQCWAFIRASSPDQFATSI